MSPEDGRLLERLRLTAGTFPVWHVCDEAADRIEAMSAAIADLERQLAEAHASLASTWSCGHARFVIALESHPECAICYRERAEQAESERDVLLEARDQAWSIIANAMSCFRGQWPTTAEEMLLFCEKWRNDWMCTNSAEVAQARDERLREEGRAQVMGRVNLGRVIEAARREGREQMREKAAKEVEECYPGSVVNYGARVLGVTDFVAIAAAIRALDVGEP